MMLTTMADFARFFDTAADKYDKVVFKTDSLFNEPAPEPVVAFLIGGVSPVTVVCLFGDPYRPLSSSSLASLACIILHF